MPILKIAIIDDDASICSSLKRFLEKSRDWEIQTYKSPMEFLEVLPNESVDTVVTDWKFEGMNGLELILQLQKFDAHLPVILMTGYGTTQTAIDSIKAGAFDYILKPFNQSQVLQLLDKAVQTRQLTSRPVSMEDTQDPNEGADLLVGRSRPMLDIFKQIGLFAPRDITVLLTGETGTGKELIARYILQNSPRKHNPFIAVNCGAIPESLLESELFGHEKGAFTGAYFRRIGRFRQADKGTIFLDEIGEISPSMQVKLLRVLQEKTVQHLGGEETHSVDVRILAATNKDLQEEVKKGNFREDLYYRLNVAHIHLPPLRERMEDVPLLAEYYNEAICRDLSLKQQPLAASFLAALKQYDWPGNVREFENSMRRALLFAKGYPLDVSQLNDIYPKKTEAKDNHSLGMELDKALMNLNEGNCLEVDSLNVPDLVGEIQKSLLLAALAYTNNNQTRAAQILGVSRQTIINKIQSLDLVSRERVSN